MITDTLNAIYSRLQGDSSLDALLARSAINTAKPAVYSTVPVPKAARLPYVVLYGPVSDTPVDTFDQHYRASLVDISCWDARPDGGGGDTSLVNTIADRVRFLLHRKPLALDGMTNMVSEVSGITINDGDDAFGRVVQLRLLTAE